MSTILKLPRGLTSILGLRSGGRTPQELADVMAGVFECRELFLLDTRECLASNTNAAPVVGANLFGGAAPGDFVVPAGELWYVWHYSVNTQPGAGADIALNPAALFDGTPLMLPLGDYQAAAAGQNVRSRTAAPFWAGPSSTLGFLARSVTLAPSVIGNAVITRLRV